MEEADAAFARARRDVAAAHGRTPMIRAVLSGLAELRAEAHFTERLEQAARNENGPAGHANGH